MYLPNYVLLDTYLESFTHGYVPLDGPYASLIVDLWIANASPL